MSEIPARRSLTIGGGTVFDQYGYIGYNSNSTGSVTLSGGLWTNSGALYVGNFGTGSLTIGSGTVSDQNGLIGNNSSSSNNLVMVREVTLSGRMVEISLSENRAGATAWSSPMEEPLIVREDLSGWGFQAAAQEVIASPSQGLIPWSNSASLNIGYADNGGDSLTISSGGSVYSANGYIGNNTSSDGNSALITGTGSLWSNTGTLTLSAYYSGSDTLTIANGGTVAATGGITIGAGGSSVINIGSRRKRYGRDSDDSHHRFWQRRRSNQLQSG